MLVFNFGKPFFDKTKGNKFLDGKKMIQLFVKENKMTPPTNIIIGRVVDLSDVIGWK